MKKKESLISLMLKVSDSPLSDVEIAKSLKITKQTFYNWKTRDTIIPKRIFELKKLLKISSSDMAAIELRYLASSRMFS